MPGYKRALQVGSLLFWDQVMLHGRLRKRVGFFKFFLINAKSNAYGGSRETP